VLHAELVGNNTADTCNGSHTEYNQCVQLIDHKYVRCRDCGVEALPDVRKAVTH
jgi:hypothetical protein